MRVRYNNVELLLSRNAMFELGTEYDRSTGLDPMYQVGTIATAFIWNPFATSSGKINPGGGAFAGLGGLGVPGDRLGPAIVILEKALNTPRARLQLFMGNDLIFDVPDLDPSGKRYPCDAMGGPLPLEAKVERIYGDKTAFGVWRCRFATTNCGRVCLSHRWSASTDTDEAGFTTRTIRGEATFNLAFLEGIAPAPRLLVDAFRSAFAHPMPLGFSRLRVQANASADARELSYVVEDGQQTLNLGPGGLVFKISGSATGGVEWPLKDIKALGGALGGAFGGAVGGLGAIFGGDIGALFHAPLGGVSWLWANLMPRQQCNAICQVYGRVGADRGQLAQYGLRVCMDRLGPILAAGLAKIVSCYVTPSHDSAGVPFCEVRMEVLGLNARALAPIFDVTAVPGMLNMTGTITGAAGAPLPAPIMDRLDYANPPFPNSAGLRGSWIENMVTQALKTAGEECDPPDDPAILYLGDTTEVLTTG